MKTFFRRHQKFIFILLAIIALAVGLYLRYLAAPQLPAPVTVPKPTPIATPPAAPPVPINTGFKSTQQIIWRLDSLNLPSTLPILYMGALNTDPNYYTPLARALSIGGSPTKIPNQPLFTYSKSDGTADFYVNLQEKVGQYQLNLENLPTSGNAITPESLTTNLIATLAPGLKLPEGISLAAANTEYQVIEEERFVSAPRSAATLVKINLNYQYLSYPITYRGLPSITAYSSIYGPLFKLRLAIPFPAYQPSQNYSLKTFAQIKNTPADQFEVVEIDGNRSFDLSTEDEVIKTTTITDGYIGYLINPTSAAVQPYVFFTGTSQSRKFGVLNVTLATPALLLPTE